MTGYAHAPNPDAHRLSPKWPRKPCGTRHSEFVLGRIANKLAYQDGKTFTVTCFRVQGNRRFYSDPVQAGSKVGPCGLYRIRVTPKGTKA